MGKTAEELRWEIDQRRSDLTRDFDAIGDRVSPQRMAERRVQAVKSRFGGIKESVMGARDSAVDGAGDAGQRAHGAAAGAVHSAQEGLHTAGERVAEVPDLVRQNTQGNPLAAGLVAFGLGLLAATVLPETRKERQLARNIQPQLEDAARTAAETGRGLAEDLKPVAQDSARSLQESAKESVQHVADGAKDAAQSVKDHTQDAAGDVKHAATT
jgi:gas vesicle protein